MLERVVAKFYMQRLAKDILSHYSILRRRLKYGFCSLYFPLYPESDLSLSLWMPLVPAKLIEKQLLK